jgi:hypothetical protein
MAVGAPRSEGGGAVTVEFYDLAQRLAAEKAGKPVLRVAQALFTLTPAAVFIDAHTTEKGVIRATFTPPAGMPTTHTGGAVLRALARAGAQMDPAQPPAQLVMQDGATLAALASIARSHHKDADPSIRAASAVIGWWIDRAGYPGTNAVVNLLAHSRQRFITAAPPDAERHTAHWRSALAVPGLPQWAQRVGAGVPLDALTPIREDDAYSFTQACARFDKGYSWTAPEPPPVAAMGLRARCDTADLWEAALLSDRLWRHRAVHTGHVTGGEVVATTKATFTVRCRRLDARLRSGADVLGWAGGLDSYDRSTHFNGDVHEATALKGALLLTIARVAAEHRPPSAQWVSLTPAPPNLRTVSMGRSKYRRLQFRADSWIASGKTPGLRRRDVPLDVLCAAAEAE